MDLLTRLNEETIKPGTKIPSFLTLDNTNGSSSGSGNGSTILANKVAEKEETAPQVPVPQQQQQYTMQHMHRLVAMTDPASALHVAVTLVNNNQHDEAIAMLDLLIERNGPAVAPLAARGTARALSGDLVGAVEDFNHAIADAPHEADFYKRRAQALGALGRDTDALHDLLKAKELCSNDAVATAEVLADAARIHHKRRNYNRAELNIRTALDLNPQLSDLLPLLAACQVGQGDLAEAAATYTGLMQAGYNQVDGIINMGMALKELCRVEDAAASLRRAANIGKGTVAEVNARRLLAQMWQGLGDHLGAIRELNAALDVAQLEGHKVELTFLRGACYHALGLHRQAVQDYQSTLEAVTEGLSPEAVSFMCLAFYQKEIALWTRANLDVPVEEVCLDADLHPEFKELWCKKTPPGADFVAMYRQIMQPQNPDWNGRANATNNGKRGPVARDVMVQLLTAADAIGAQVQYRHQGFLPNKRQRRMAGLAAIEYAQLLQSAAAAARRNAAADESTLTSTPHIEVPDVGSSVCARGPSGIGGGGHGRPNSTHPLGWRDAMEVIVKWRQVSEPNDQVLWVDLLTEKEFSAGFGSHTPIFTGQTKCVRYYMNFDRALEVAKGVALSQGYVYDADNKQIEIHGARADALAAAATAEEYWHAVGGRDSWVVVPVESSVRPGHGMEGTRLTVVNLEKIRDKEQQQQAHELAVHGVGELSLFGEESQKQQRQQQQQPHSFEFSIRTPVTPARWKEYDEELSGIFDALVTALAQGSPRLIADLALRFAYYWYNFMPLARGSALCGYVSILGVFLAANMPVRGLIPASVQTDWVAILSSSPGAFIASVGGWLLPPEVSSRDVGGSGSGGDGDAEEGEKEDDHEGSGGCRPPAAEELPHVKSALMTMRERLQALNEGASPTPLEI